MKASHDLHRSEVATEMTWNLDDLFTDNASWRQAIEKAQGLLDQLVLLKGKTTESADQLYAFILSYEELYIQLSQIGTYVSLKNSADGSDPENQALAMEFSSFAAKTSALLSFFNNEITALDADDYELLFSQNTKLETYRKFLNHIYRKKDHLLSSEIENILAQYTEINQAPYRIYNISKSADMVFKPFKDEKGHEYENSFNLFESKYEFSSNPTIRKNGFESFSQTLNQYKNTYAAIYGTEVKNQIITSRLRGYPSVTHMLLEAHEIEADAYHQQIDYIYTHLAPHMRKLAQIKKRELGLNHLSFHDLKAPLDPAFNPTASYEEIQSAIIESLSILGESYQDIVKKAFNNRWIDYANNKGKASGAFCASPYGVHPYILITYQDTMRSAFTLTHELGHAGHFYLGMQNQEAFNLRPSTYFVEAPSTINELFLAKYLMKKDSSPRMKRWVILQLLETYYHNFVTHLLEAEFQRRVYTHAENHVGLTAKLLCETKSEVLKEFWGDEVVIDDYAGLTWMRQPHYYMGLYPYTYSAGLTAATAISKKIDEDGQKAVDAWVETLKLGGKLPPHELLKHAGIDMTSTKPFETAVAYVGECIEELDQLFKL